MQAVSGSEPQRKRRRPALACVQCRRRKVRCDREDPCGPCSRLGGGSGASACWYHSDHLNNGEHHNTGDLVLANQATSNGSFIPGRSSSGALHVPNGGFPANSTAPSGTSGTSRISSIHGTPYNVTKEPFAAMTTVDAPPSNLGLEGRSNQTPITVESQDHLQHADFQDRADDTRLEPIHSTLEAITSRLQRLEQHSDIARANKSTPSNDGPPIETASEGYLFVPTTLPSLRNDPEKTRFWGTSHYRHFFDERFSLFGRLKSKDVRQNTGDNARTKGIIHLVERCRGLRMQIKESRRSTIIDPFSDILGTLPPMEVRRRLANTYLKSMEPLYRVLHIPTFWAEFDRNWRDMDAAPLSFQLKLLSVMAIGSAFTPVRGTSDNVNSNISRWIQAVQWWLSGPSERLTFSLDGLQIRCLLLIACYVNSVGTKASRWILAASIRRSACSLGLHRDPATFPNVSPFISEMRKRLWVTILELDLQATFDANMPYDVSSEAFDCGPPSDISDEELLETDTSLLPAHRRRHPSHTALQRLLVRYLPLRISILRFLNTTKDQSSFEEALKLGSELQGLRRELQMEARRQDSQHAPGMYATFHDRYLDSLVLRYVLFLHRPFAIRAMQDPRFYYSRKECCDASFALLIPIAEGDLMSTDQGHLPPGSIGSIAGAVSVDAIIYLCLELIQQTEEQGPQRPGSHTHIRDFTQDSRDNILSLLRRVRDRLLESIWEGDTSLKKFIFLDSALSQIEATAAGRPAELALTETLTNSLVQCRNLLLQHLPVPDISSEPGFSDPFGMNGRLPDFGALEDLESWLQSSADMNLFGIQP